MTKMRPPLVKKTEDLLMELNIDAEIIAHSDVDGTHSDIIAEALDVPLENIIKCLILKSKKGNLIAAVVLGTQKLDMRKLSLLSGLKKLSLASQDSIKKITEHKIGGIPPFAIIQKIDVYVDEAVLQKDFVIGSAGSPHYGLKFHPTVLIRFNVHVEKFGI